MHYAARWPHRGRVAWASPRLRAEFLIPKMRSIGQAWQRGGEVVVGVGVGAGAGVGVGVGLGVGVGVSVGVGVGVGWAWARGWASAWFRCSR